MSPHLFAPDPGPAPGSRFQSVACARPGCRRPAFTSHYGCELHWGDFEDFQLVPPDVARLIGPTNAWAKTEERGPR
jgi:hypothetical protein